MNFLQKTKWWLQDIVLVGGRTQLALKDIHISQLRCRITLLESKIDFVRLVLEGKEENVLEVARIAIGIKK